MGLFDSFKKKETKQNYESKILLAMPLFTDGNRYNLDLIFKCLKDDWGLNVTDFDGNDETAVFKVDGEMVAITFMPIQIPLNDLENTAKFAYNWNNAIEELKNTDGHAIVSIMSVTKSTKERYQILSKILCSILSTSESIGIYQGNQTLLIPKNQYLDYSQTIKDGGIPVPLWIYIGIRRPEQGNSIYTYGLKDFNKLEMEIVNSKLEIEELYNFILNITSYVIQNDIIFKSGETLGYTENQKIPIISSKGEFLEETTLKLEI